MNKGRLPGIVSVIVLILVVEQGDITWDVSVIVLISVVEQGEITWDDEEEFEVEQILDHVVEEEVSTCYFPKLKFVGPCFRIFLFGIADPWV